MSANIKVTKKSGETYIVNLEVPEHIADKDVEKRTYISNWIDNNLINVISWEE